MARLRSISSKPVLPWRRRLVLAMLVVAAVGCQPGLPGGMVTILAGDGAAAVATASTVTVALQVAAPMAVQAILPRTTTQVDHYRVRLYDWTGAALGAMRHSHSTTNNTNMTVNFSNVPPGNYKVTAEAFADAGETQNITQGGPQQSTNTVLVAYGADPLYSADTKLIVSLHLLDGVGDNINNTISVTAGRTTTDAGLAPDDAGSASTMHDYTITRGAVTSTFVWIPRFNAIQLINPGNCGTQQRLSDNVQDNARPPGFWVNPAPAPGGTPGVDHVTEPLGGFYVAKYEASREDATAAADGTSGVLSVRSNVVPWANISWDVAASKCREFHPRAHLMTDEEWAALAIYAQINDHKPFGNTNSGQDETATINFTDDPTESAGSPGRALTGTGTTQTSHTLTADGVYDLIGNVAEWTASVHRETATDNWYIDGLGTGLTAVTAFSDIAGLETHPLLRRHGLPVTGTAATEFRGDIAAGAGSGMAAKMNRGGNWVNGAQAGLWRSDVSPDRSYTGANVGFRPALRF